MLPVVHSHCQGVFLIAQKTLIYNGIAQKLLNLLWYQGPEILACSDGSQAGGHVSKNEVKPQ